MEQTLQQIQSLLVNAGGKILLALAVWIVGRFVISKITGSLNKLPSVRKMDETVRSFLNSFVKILLKIVFQGSNTAFVGEFSNVTMSCVFVLCASLIYKRNKTKKTAVLSMVIASVLVSIVGIFLNAFVMFPLYSNLYHMPMEAIVAAGSAVNPLVKDEVTLMLFAVFPFNLVKHAITSLVTFLIYKRSGRVLRGLLQGAK